MDSAVIPLTVDSLPKLRLARHSRFDNLTLRVHVTENAEFCWRVDGTHEYIVGGRWRKRRDIAHILEMAQGPHRDALLSHLLAVFKRTGFHLAVVACDDDSLHTSFYVGHGFETLDKIIELERYSRGSSPVEGRETVRVYRPADFEAVMRVDEESFPWLWQNSREEFDWYSSLPEVEVYVAESSEGVVGYAGITIYGMNGHLDRIAVSPAWQHRGYGSALLSFVIRRMEHRRVKRIGLSTQMENTKSQSLYRRFGFRHTSRSQVVCGVRLE